MVPAIAQVEPLTTARALRGPFDYRLPANLAGVGIGSMVVVPFGRQELLGVVVGLSDRSDVAEDKLLAPRRALELGVPADLVALAGWIAREYCSTPARALALVLPPGTARGAAPLARLVVELTPPGRAALAADPPARGPDGRPLLTPVRRAALERLSPGALPATAAGASRAVLARLAELGLVRLERRAVPRRPPRVAVGARLAGAPRLTPEQDRALAAISAALAARRPDRFLLHGVTGSGKTEVYLRAAEHALGTGRGAIVLVPEIALTPQIASRFVERFGDTVAILHSRLSEGQRHDEWRRLRSGQARVCVGPRSAVFAPIEDLGVVVVDEEHDSSYKHEGDPRYDARAVAEERAARSGAVLVAGSATPRPESYRRLARLGLASRVDGRPLPPVEVLDMRGARHALHSETARALSDLRAARGKAIVLLNRRGWSNFLSCRSCGRVWTCPDCDVSLVLHRGEGAVACHHCGHRQRVPERCTQCASVSVARHGVGTERLEHELAAALDDGGFPIFRLDADAAAARDGVTEVLTSFEAAACGVLVGTQMVAKGHDFPGVALGVVLDADATLRFPDFRAEERTFALVAQLAGRAGRGRSGRVLVQTTAPDASAIVHAARHDSQGFLEHELGRREALGYPPFTDLVRVVCASPQPGSARRAAHAVCDRLHAPGATVLGPAPLFRLRGRERSQLVIKASRRGPAIAATGAAVAEAAADRRHAGVSFSVDVDPQ